MGRSIYISSANIDDCCTIAFEDIPDTYDPTVAYRDLLESTPDEIPFMPEAFGIFGGFGSGAYQQQHSHGAQGEEEGHCQINLNFNEDDDKDKK